MKFYYLVVSLSPLFCFILPQLNILSFYISLVPIQFLYHVLLPAPINQKKKKCSRFMDSQKLESWCLKNLFGFSFQYWTVQTLVGGCTCSIHKTEIQQLCYKSRYCHLCKPFVRLIKSLNKCVSMLIYICQAGCNWQCSVHLAH